MHYLCNMWDTTLAAEHDICYHGQAPPQILSIPTASCKLSQNFLIIYCAYTDQVPNQF